MADVRLEPPWSAAALDTAPCTAHEPSDCLRSEGGYAGAHARLARGLCMVLCRHGLGRPLLGNAWDRTQDS